MARFKISAPLPTGDYGVEYIVNPEGAIWGVHEDHVAPGWPRKPGDPARTIVELAERREDGWRLATEDEIRKHVKDTGEWLPPELEGTPEKVRPSAESSSGPEPEHMAPPPRRAAAKTESAKTD